MSPLSDNYKTQSLPLDQIVPLDFSSIPGLPDSHAWSPNDDDDGGSSTIPLIDLMDPNAMEQIGLACEKWGAFQLKNHGIPFSDILDVEEESKRLFSLPTEHKLKALRSADGATGYGRARISPFFSKFMWHEGYTIIGSPSHDAKKIWPNDYARFCEVMENYEKQMKSVAERLTEMTMKWLEVSEEKRKWVGGSNITGAVQLNCYPNCPEPERAMGLAPHTDTSFFTILQSQTSGLQIKTDHEEKGWTTVHPLPNTLIIFAGDFLHILSNSRFRAALHRVTVNRNQKRYSGAYFYSPPLDYLVSPVLHNSVPRFRDVTVKEYVQIRAKNFGDALSFITLPN